MADAALLNRPNPAPLTLDKAIPVHFIGIGGIGMSGLAKILLEQGYTVTGSDAKESPMLDSLRALGGQIVSPHQAESLGNAGVVVASSAIRDNNPEAQAARQRGLAIHHRSDLLRELLKTHQTVIGLTGTHGKTTMTGMTGLVLEEGGLSPTIVAGGVIPKLKTNAQSGQTTALAVAELDESDGTVVQYQPQISVIANLELDHPDHYTDGISALRQTFETYLSQLPAGSSVLFNMDCPETKRLYHFASPSLDKIKVYTMSTPSHRDESTYWLDNWVLHLEGAYQADVMQGNTVLGTLWLQAPGKHNMWNALYAAVMGHRLGVPFAQIRRTLENFTGMGRRFEQLGTFNGARVVDDYAHHPTEVIATLKAAQEFNRGKGRVIAMFQPHRVQRLKTLWSEFLEAFEDADELIVLDVYTAGESPESGVDSASFVSALDHPSAEHWPSVDPALMTARLKAILTPGDLLITLGAGDITRIGRDLVRQDAP